MSMIQGEEIGKKLEEHPELREDVDTEEIFDLGRTEIQEGFGGHNAGIVHQDCDRAADDISGQ